MRKKRIYQPSEYTVDRVLDLSKVASQHICRVLRLNNGDEIILFDGHGQSAIAQLHDPSPKSCQVLIKRLIDEKTESPLKIHLGLGISKGDRMDYAIQKSVEAGVTEITPLITERTIVKLDDKREQKKLDHWQGIVISACEQSGRSVLPILNPVHTLSDWVTLDSQCKIVFDCDAEQPLTHLPVAEEAVLLIGPEGGLSPNEIENAHNTAFIKAKMGPRILRTESAAAMACGVLQMLWGDYRH